MNLVAVQAHMQLSDYETAEAFHKKIISLTEKSLEGLPDGETLLAFPEAIGFPLLLTLGHFKQVKDRSSIRQAMLSYVRQDWQKLLTAMWKNRAFGLKALYLAQAVSAYTVYKRAFSEAAQSYGVTIVAGSHFLPHIEEEGARGIHIANPKVFNTAFSFAPTGTLLNRSRKVYLNAGSESRSGLNKGKLSELSFMQSPVGKVGVAICLDAFYSSVMEHFDALGTEIIVQPSANHASWFRRWPRDTVLTEGEAWFAYGLLHQVQNRQNIRLGVNPMLVGKLWDLEASGRSSIVANTGYYPEAFTEQPGILAIAESPFEESFVRVSL